MVENQKSKGRSLEGRRELAPGGNLSWTLRIHVVGDSGGKKNSRHRRSQRRNREGRREVTQGWEGLEPVWFGLQNGIFPTGVLVSSEAPMKDGAENVVANFFQHLNRVGEDPEHKFCWLYKKGDFLISLFPLLFLFCARGIIVEALPFALWVGLAHDLFIGHH